MPFVENIPPSVEYIPNFLSEEAAAGLWREVWPHITLRSISFISVPSCAIFKVYNAPKPKWTHLSNRRLQQWGGVVPGDGSRFISEALPSWLSSLTSRLIPLAVFAESAPANHVLINEYEAGQGIMPHTDGPAYEPTIATVSLGSHTVLDLYADQGSRTTPDFSLLLEPHSLVIIRQDVYTAHLHGIAERTTDDSRSVANASLLTHQYQDKPELVRSTRVSLTIRRAKNERKIPQSLLKGLKR